jgi:hypothetical protein
VKIPEAIYERSDFVSEVLDVCKASQESRCSSYRMLKQYYLFGAESASSVSSNLYGVINKLQPQIDKSCSMLYASDTTRFAVEIGRSVPRAELMKIGPLTDAVSDRWHGCEADTKFGITLEWSHVYGSMFLKTRPRNQNLLIDIVEPHHMGVYREDLMGLESQEAFFHEYRITKSQLAFELRTAGFPDPGIEAICKEAIANTGDDEEGAVSNPIDSITTSSAFPTAQGQLNTFLGQRPSYRARLKQPLVRMYELYVFDDDLEDYRIFTCAAPNVPVYDRKLETMFLQDELPFVQVMPYPLYGYFWGQTAVERLLTLQMLRNTRWDQVQHLMEMQANPSKFVAGDMATPGEEIQAAMDSPGGLVVSALAGSDAKNIQQEMPDDLFAEVNYLDTQFDDAIGTTDIMGGKGEEGVRSEGHATQLLRTGSSRLRKRALIIERQIEEVATLILKIEKVYSDRTYTYEDENKQQVEFTAEQFTDDFMVRVDAHSSSPVFMQDMANMAFALFKAKAIAREDLIDMLNVPMKDLLKMRLKTKIEPQEAKQAEEARKLALVTGKAPKAASK